MTTVVLTQPAFQEAFNALLTRAHNLARELEYPDLKADEREELQQAFAGTQSALDSMQAALATEEGR